MDLPKIIETCPFFGIDIGGTLVKVVFFKPQLIRPDEEEIVNKICHCFVTESRDTQLEISNCIINERVGNLHFRRFATSDVPKFIDWLKEQNIAHLIKQVCATGGGAFKFEDEIRTKLGISLRKSDELDTVIRGINFIERFNSRTQCYYYIDPLGVDPRKAHFDFKTPYPYMLVNIGSGVSILSVKSLDSYTRVWGSSIGGGTFEGLCCSLLNRQISFEEAIKLADQGCAKKVDKLVKDIYGGDYTKFDLKGDLVASSFGNMIQPDIRNDAKPQDLARGVLELVTLNIASIARLCAAIEKLERIVFIGNFLRVNPLSMKLLAYALDYWSSGKLKALFLEHEGYFGAVGCLVESYGQLDE